MKSKTLFFVILGFLALPVLNASAQLFWGLQEITVGALIENIKWVIWVVFAVMVVISFVIAGIMFLTARGDPQKLTLARSAFIWGCVGVVVGIVAYSILSIIGNVLLYY